MGEISVAALRRNQPPTAGAIAQTPLGSNTGESKRRPSTRRAAALPDLRLRGLPLPGQPDILLVQQHHADLAAGLRLVVGDDVGEAVAGVVALDAVAAGGEDVRPVDGEVAGPHAPFAVDDVGRCEVRRNRREEGCEERGSGDLPDAHPHGEVLHECGSADYTRRPRLCAILV